MKAASAEAWRCRSLSDLSHCVSFFISAATFCPSSCPVLPCLLSFLFSTFAFVVFCEWRQVSSSPQECVAGDQLAHSQTGASDSSALHFFSSYSFLSVSLRSPRLFFFVNLSSNRGTAAAAEASKLWLVRRELKEELWTIIELIFFLRISFDCDQHDLDLIVSP